jgi:hypothetical protein
MVPIMDNDRDLLWLSIMVNDKDLLRVMIRIYYGFLLWN